MTYETANHLSREESQALETRDDLWIEWSPSTKGTFILHRNGGFPVFPLTRSERQWLNIQIKDIYNLGQYAL